MIRVGVSETESQLDEAAAGLLASGRVDAALALFVDSAMALRGRSEPGDAIAGALLEAAEPVSLSEGALERTLALIDAGDAAPLRRQAHGDDLIRLPPMLREAIETAEQGAGWKGVAPGIRQLKLDVRGATASAEILRIDAGAAVPPHTHAGQELTLCLIGGFSDGRGSYGPGDISLADPSVRHRPRADADGPCYVLAVTDADLRFEGVLGLLQKLFAK